LRDNACLLFMPQVMIFPLRGARGLPAQLLSRITSMKKFLLFPLAFFLLLASFPASAKGFRTGTQESITFVTDLKLPPQNGKTLFLGRKKTMKWLGLPYYVKSDGLVFGVQGDSKAYIELPDAKQMELFQQAGLLPNPLPSVGLSLSDYLLGYSLWLLLLVLALYYGIRAFFKRRSS
jgi:hypothetical protein